MRVILRPTAKNAWSGLKKYRNCYEDISTYYTRSGQLYTGLSKTEADELGSTLGIDLSPNSEYWNTFFIRTSGKDLYLDIEDPLDKLRYLFLKNHRRVKKSLMENKATANFVLINKDEEAKKANIYNRVKRDSIKEFDRLSPEDIRMALRLYGHNADSMSNEVAENRLFDIIEGNPQSFLDKWVNNKSRDTEVLVERAISRNIIRRNKNIYRYGTEIIGHSLADTVGFLNDAKNQDIKITIIKSLESKGTINVTPEPIVDDEPTPKKTGGRAKKVITDEEVDAVKAASPDGGDTI